MHDDGNPCPHHRIDNETWQCVACQERMIGRTMEAETIRSAPNAAPCRNPDHLAAIEAGDEFECHHPYMPDVSRERTIVIGYDCSYQCERCSNNGNTFWDTSGVSWDCGRVHRGRRIPVRVS